MIFGIDPKMRKISKKSKNEAKAMPREARVHCCSVAGHPGEGLPGLMGGTPPAPQLAELSGNRASSEATFFDANFRIVV